MSTTTSSSVPPAGEPCLPFDRSAASKWWEPNLPLPLEKETKKLFTEYAHIPEDQLEQHLYQIRKEAWETCPFPCIGGWLFLKLQLRKNREFDEAVKRTQQGENLLDFGCALGQDLRSLIHAGSPPSTLHGADLEPKYIAAGAALFNDDGGGITFRAADALHPTETLADWQGRFNIVTSNYVQHCFLELEQQHIFAATLLALLTGKPGDLLFGRVAGTRRGGRVERLLSIAFYRHSETSFQEFWHSAAQRVGRSVSIETRIDEELLLGGC